MRDPREFIPAVDGPFARLFTNPLSVHLTRFLMRTGVTPNQVSLAAFLLASASSLLFLRGTHAAWVAGGMLCQFAFVLDGCDGTLARATNRTSYFGAWMDRFLDAVMDLHFALTLGIGYALAHGAPPPSGQVLLLLGTNLLHLSAWNITTPSAPELPEARPDAWEAALRRRGIRLVFGRDLYLLSVTIGAFLYSWDFIFWSVFVFRNACTLRRLRRTLWFFDSTPPRERKVARD